MTIELLYPETANLFGDLMNAKLLKTAIPGVELVETGLKARPRFVDEDVSMILLCSMTERSQELVAKALMPFKDRLSELIEGGTVFLITGNAMEIFGSYIEDEDGSRIEGLNLFNFHAKRRMMNRFNSLYLGKCGDMEIVGFKSQFSHAYGEGFDPLFETLRGVGMNRETMPEGIRKNNFMATYVLGPLLVLNPDFAKYIFRLLGAADAVLSFEEAAYDAYNLRLAEFKDPKTGFGY